MPTIYFVKTDKRLTALDIDQTWPGLAWVGLAWTHGIERSGYINIVNHGN